MTVAVNDIAVLVLFAIVSVSESRIVPFWSQRTAVRVSDEVTFEDEDPET